ncbi:Retrovirus-related Pol polyprotein from transposon RE1 [Abeliophyllum distichum]|uniref:Retrovirus-related Pol polyprotein from transposon RE1 n=1 Tax=Abeliophyllum distichum TaxID=126358 RepID=A0ABD1PRT1_9LAMI
MPLDLIHTDVWGPSPVNSTSGFKYYVLFVDDCTRPYVENDEVVNEQSQQNGHETIQPESSESQSRIKIWVEMPTVAEDADKNRGNKEISEIGIDEVKCGGVEAGIMKPKVYSTDVTLPSLDEIEPGNLNEALKSEKWCKAMKEEYDALMKNQTWVLVPYVSTMKVIGCRWVYKLKFDANGEIQRHKARLVAKGYSQTSGVDYYETFSPVAKSTNLEAKPFMDSNKLLELGMILLKETLLKWEFKQSRADNSVFYQESQDQIIYLLVYVDDIIVTGTAEQHYRSKLRS